MSCVGGGSLVTRGCYREMARKVSWKTLFFSASLLMVEFTDISHNKVELEKSCKWKRTFCLLLGCVVKLRVLKVEGGVATMTHHSFSFKDCLFCKIFVGEDFLWRGVSSLVNVVFKFVGFTGTSCANSKKSWVTLYIKHTKETHTQTIHEHTYIRPICTRTHIDTSELVGKHRTNNLPFFFLFLNDLCYLNSLSHTSRQKEIKDMW